MDLCRKHREESPRSGAILPNNQTAALLIRLMHCCVTASMERTYHPSVKMNTLLRRNGILNKSVYDILSLFRFFSKEFFCFKNISAWLKIKISKKINKIYYWVWVDRQNILWFSIREIYKKIKIKISKNKYWNLHKPIYRWEDFF